MHSIDPKRDPADGAPVVQPQPLAPSGRVIRGRSIVDDPWLLVADDPVPEHGPVLVTMARWLAEAATLRQRADPAGVLIAPADEVEALAGQLDGLALVAVDFPVFTDGRGYSSARLLRERLGYTGELRAVGDVIKDTLCHLKRCGFDAFAVRADQDIAEAMSGLDDFTFGYQASVDQPMPLFRSRAERRFGLTQAGD